MKLVFIHGSGGTGRVWKYQTEHFPGSLAVTLPGHPDGATHFVFAEVPDEVNRAIAGFVDSLGAA